VNSVMKRASVLMLTMAGLLVAAQAATADEVATARIPFAFVVNGVELPAGDYIVSRDASQPALISISTRDGERRTLTLSRAAGEPGSAGAGPQLEFERVGKQLHLSRIRLGGSDSRDIAVGTAVEERVAELTPFTVRLHPR